MLEESVEDGQNRDDRLLYDEETSVSPQWGMKRGMTTEIRSTPR
jgi:hypothetical protein